MKRFFEILKKLVLIGGIIAVVWASVPNIGYADPGDGGGTDGGEHLPDPPAPPTP